MNLSIPPISIKLLAPQLYLAASILTPELHNLALQNSPHFPYPLGFSSLALSRSEKMARPHILLVTFPAQGHINPGLQLAKRLVGLGLQVTFATSIGAHRRMAKATTHKGLSFATFSDGYDDGYEPGDDIEVYMSELRRHGSRTLAELIVSNASSGNSFTCIIYSILIPWVAKVAREHHLPRIFLWNQPAAVLEIYYFYFHGYGETVDKNINDPEFSLELPGLPSLAKKDLPSFFGNLKDYPFALPITKEQLGVLDQEASPTVLVNTFDDLEAEPLKSINNYKLIGIGPLIPSAFLDGKDPSDNSFGADLFHGSKNYIEWLNSKPDSSVIYISFGSISEMSKRQKEEVARALIDTGRPFLWVVRSSGQEEKEEDRLSCEEELEKQGIIVSWCSQVEVLCHPSTGCFMTHCGWNSTFESLVAGVPVVAFPQWTDQFTNAKLVQDVWRTGVRVRCNEEGIVESEEIRRCLELVVGKEEMRCNAKKWKNLARKASTEGGSSDKNLKALVDMIAQDRFGLQRD